MHDIENLKRKIINEANLLGYDSFKISNTIKHAEYLHQGQNRKSGEPYIVHPLEVALKILSLNIGQEAVIAALLHDTLEDTNITFEEIKNTYGEEVAFLVNGVTKVSSFTNNSLNRYQELESLRKLVIASSEDIRVLIIKLADRLHNMETISVLRPEKQVIYSEETLKVYVPLAEYIGLGSWKRKIEDIAFKTKDPISYELMNQLIRNDARVHKKLADYLIDELKEMLDKQRVRYTRVYGRVKSAFSLYNKILRKTKETNQQPSEFDIKKIKDLVGVSIILPDDPGDCYKVLGYIHAKYRFFEKDFTDYIAKPKPNGYRSIHTIIEFKGRPCEIQIKTEEMHEVNEFGPASHIAYKLSGKKYANKTDEFTWVKSLNLWYDDSDKSTNKFKLNIFADKVYALTPKGKIIELEKGATPIDFAYAIHTQIGNNFTGALINGSIAKLDTKINNGDIVQILTSNHDKKPSLEWLNIVKQSDTKAKIKKALKNHEKELLIEKGKKNLSDYLMDKIKIDWSILDSPTISKLLKTLEIDSIDRFYASIAIGTLQKKRVLQNLIKLLNLKTETHTLQEQKHEDSENKNHPKTTKDKIIVCGMEDLDYKIAGCCNPKKPQEIVGVVTLRDGLKIHCKNCKNLIDFPQERLLEAKFV